MKHNCVVALSAYLQSACLLACCLLLPYDAAQYRAMLSPFLTSFALPTRKAVLTVWGRGRPNGSIRHFWCCFPLSERTSPFLPFALPCKTTRRPGVRNTHCQWLDCSQRSSTKYYTPPAWRVFDKDWSVLELLSLGLTLLLLVVWPHWGLRAEQGSAPQEQGAIFAEREQEQQGQQGCANLPARIE